MTKNDAILTKMVMIFRLLIYRPVPRIPNSARSQASKPAGRCQTRRIGTCPCPADLEIGVCLAQSWHGCVPQVSKPAVSPASKPARCTAVGRFGNLRHGRLGSLRYAKQIRKPAPARIWKSAPRRETPTKAGCARLAVNHLIIVASYAN